MAWFFRYYILNQRPLTGVITHFTTVAYSIMLMLAFVSARDLFAMKPSITTHNDNLKQIMYI